MINKDFPLASNLVFKSLAIVLALLFTTLIMLRSQSPALEAYSHYPDRIIGSIGKISDVLVAWVPLLLATSGLLITFAAGLWNIGIEGQITLGAIFTTWALRLLQDSGLPPALIIMLGILAGMLGGALWASLAGSAQDFRRRERDFRRPWA